MAFNDRYEHEHGGTGNEGDSENFIVNVHHTPAVEEVTDHTPQAAANHAVAQTMGGSTSTKNSMLAQHGMSIAIQGGSLKGQPSPFTASEGMFTTSDRVAHGFVEALHYSGGVRQGPGYVSDPAPGVTRVGSEHWVTLNDMHQQSEGLGNTFESQRRARWIKD